MRHFLLCAASALWLAVPASAQSFRVVTWHSDDFPAPAPGAGTNDPDVKRLRLMASTLKPHNADLIVLEGMADRQSGQKLAGFLKPASFTIASFNVFRGGTSNQPIASSVTVLSRKTPLAARAVDWRTSGVDTPGGFHFVAVPLGSNALCFYAAQFVDPLAAHTNARAAQANARKRELAAQYLIHHSKWLETTLTNPFSGFVVAGNVSAGLELWPTDNSPRLLEQGGFRRAALPAGGEAGLKAPQDWFARNAEFTSAPQVGSPRNFSYGPVLYELAFKTSAPPASLVATVPATAASAPGPKPVAGPGSERLFKIIAVDERFVWLAAPVLGAVLLFLILLIPYRWATARRRSQAVMLRRKSANPVVVDFAPSVTLDEGHGPAGELPDAGESSQWQERVKQAEQRANKATAVVREGLMPQLVRLMREKIFQRLTSQRAQLLDSHLNGTMAVLELEERLEKIQSQFAMRLAAREQRIAELEAELAAKENIIRELIKAQAKLAGRVSNE